CFRCQQFRHVRLRPARLAAIEATGSLSHHECRGLHLHMGTSERKLNALILADRSAEHLPLARVARSLFHEPASVADAFSADEDALYVHAVEYISEATPF